MDFCMLMIVGRIKWEDEKLVVDGNRQGYKLNQINSPTFIVVDAEQSVHISDWGNHCVMK